LFSQEQTLMLAQPYLLSTPKRIIVIASQVQLKASDRLQRAEKDSRNSANWSCNLKIICNV